MKSVVQFSCKFEKKPSDRNMSDNLQVTCRGSSGRIMTTLRVGRSTVRIPACVTYSFLLRNVHNPPGGHPDSYSGAPRAPFPGVRMSFQLWVASRFRLNGGLAPLSFPANIVCSGTALTLSYIRLKGFRATNKRTGFCWDVTSCSLVNLLTHSLNTLQWRRQWNPL